MGVVCCWDGHDPVSGRLRRDWMWLRGGRGPAISQFWAGCGRLGAAPGRVRVGRVPVPGRLRRGWGRKSHCRRAALQIIVSRAHDFWTCVRLRPPRWGREVVAGGQIRVFCRLKAVQGPVLTAWRGSRAPSIAPRKHCRVHRPHCRAEIRELVATASRGVWSLPGDGPKCAVERRSQRFARRPIAGFCGPSVQTAAPERSLNIGEW